MFAFSVLCFIDSALLFFLSYFMLRIKASRNPQICLPKIQ